MPIIAGGNNFDPLLLFNFELFPFDAELAETEPTWVSLFSFH
jgi:hypothetical protein